MSRGWEKTTLLCNDGSALDRLAAAFMYAHLYKHKLINDEKPELPIDAKAQAILECAAIHGSYSAAHYLTSRVKSTISRCTSLTQCDAYFEKFCKEIFYPYLVPRFKTVAYLLLIEIQLELFIKNHTPHHENFEQDTLMLREKHHFIELYRSLRYAEKDEKLCKNILRLSFEADTPAARLQQLFGTIILGMSKNGIPEVSDLRLFLKNKCNGDLQLDLERVDTAIDDEAGLTLSHLTLTTKP